MSDARTELLKALAVTAELCGTEISEAAAMAYADELERYDFDGVIHALHRLRLEHSGRLSLAEIVKRMPADPNAHPGSDEAWALCPKDEGVTVVTTREIIAAWTVASDLYADGDRIGARMAFREAYERECQRSLMPRWFPSMGTEAYGRAGPIIQAVRDGKLPITAAYDHIGKGSEEVRQALGPDPREKPSAIPDMRGRQHAIASMIREVFKPVDDSSLPEPLPEPDMEAEKRRIRAYLQSAVG